MALTGFNINITSEQPDKLVAFYRDVVGLPQAPEDQGGGFMVGDVPVIFIDGHSETQGPPKEPQRCLINFWVDDIDAEQERLKAQGVPFIREKGKEFWGGVISTFLDPDGNYCQLMYYQAD